ncbi:hypothetical protein CTAYLR_003651 [Chrysophaeum taylorii]|uniref:PCI domain-containing protein n=1 Tax=Chrysophaeum taylorii TaxID=2483200 RepID=A0AAD7XK15_9STRA|nr:hypothetical protein CTAYLR_003651 [Chrysophaeum taylorii]
MEASEASVSKNKTDQSAFASSVVAEARAALETTGSLDAPSVLEALLAAEKKCRLSNDAYAARTVTSCIVSMCRELKEWDRLNSMLTLLSKRRSQSKVVITALLEEGISLLETTEPVAELADEGAREKLLVTLSEITEGKMYCEGERAKITRMLSALKEARGDVSGAADVLQTVNAETYGSLSKRQKVDFILEQVRLMLAKGDRIRAYIISKKVQRKTLEDDELEDLKIRFYRLMIEYHAREGDEAPFDLAQHYWAIYKTKCVSEDPTQWRDALSSCAIFLVLSDYSPAVSDMTHRVLASEKQKLAECPPGISKALELFVRREIIAYPLSDQDAIENHAALGTAGPQVRAAWKELLHTRVVQHNIRIVSTYYRQIRVPRLAQLLGLTEDDAERHVSHMVSNSGLYCKIDRPAGIARFAKPKPPEEVLSDWAADISKMLNLVEMTCHLINKEMMIHKL